MNSNAKGREHGYAAYLADTQISLDAFIRMARAHARIHCKTAASRRLYVDGWVSNWRKQYTPTTDEILTF